MPTSKHRKEHASKKKQRVQKQVDVKNSAKNNLKFLSRVLPTITALK